MSNPTTSWPLIAPAETPQTVPPSGPKAIPTPDASGFTLFGEGIIRPFQRDQRGDIKSANDVRLVIAAVGQILGTVASSEFSQGEMPWRPEFGSLLHLLRHRPNTPALAEIARQYVIDSLQRWERRIVLTDTAVIRDINAEGGLNALTIKVRFNFVDNSGSIVFQDLESSITI